MSRRVPAVSVVLTVPLWALGDVSDAGSTSPQNAPFILITGVTCYLMGRRSPGTCAALLLFAASATALTASAALAPPAAVAWFTLTMYLLFFGVLPWLLGRYRRRHRKLVVSGWERAERLERERRILAEQARLRERARIAGDMHDSLGHEPSLIALLAGALEVDRSLGERHRALAAELRSRADAAVRRLHETIGVLREGTEAQPAGESVQELVERARGSGMDVKPPRWEDLPGLPPLVERAVYRVVQESLTNAAKHAPGAPVQVRIGVRSGHVEVAVVNGPPVHAPPAGRGTGGNGLVGLRERARLTGGTMHAAPTGEGGFEVSARLPLDPDAALAPASGDPGAAEPELESAHQRHRMERGVRRSLVIAIAVPTLLGLGMAAAVIGLFIWQTLASLLEPDDYAALRVGQRRAEIASRLPSRQYPERPPGVREPPVPSGARCEYYRSSGNVPARDVVYRLCFKDGRLASKDVLSAEHPASGTQGG